MESKELNRISIWSILESDEFEKAFKNRIDNLKRVLGYSGPGSTRGRFRYKGTGPLISVFDKYYSDEEGIVVEFVKIMSKNSRLSSSERKAIIGLVSPVINNIAKERTNEMFDKKENAEKQK